MGNILTVLRHAVRWLVATALFVMMVITCLDVIGRYVVSRPFPGSAELVQYLMITAVFAALPVVTLRGEHINISLLDAMLGARSRQIHRALVCLLSSAIVAVLTHRFWLHAEMLAANRDVIGFLNLPVAPAAFLASLFSGLTTVLLIAMAVSELAGAGALDAGDQGQGGGERE